MVYYYGGWWRHLCYDWTYCEGALLLFYADDGMIASRGPVWLQEALTVLVALFQGLTASSKSFPSSSSVKVATPISLTCSTRLWRKLCCCLTVNPGLLVMLCGLHCGASITGLLEEWPTWCPTEGQKCLVVSLIDEEVNEPDLCTIKHCVNKHQQCMVD